MTVGGSLLLRLSLAMFYQLIIVQLSSVAQISPGGILILGQATVSSSSGFIVEHYLT